MSKHKLRAAIAFYCVAIWLVLDGAYSQFAHVEDPPLIRVDEHYHHGLFPNFQGPAVWGGSRYTQYTNNLAFRDTAIRDVPLKSESYRIVLIGDSFTEGLGVRYEDSFAGLLAQAGRERPDQIEVLNAGVLSYSPTIYYKKIKYLLESGLKFDELVVLPDASDVHDEATGYFCFDDDPRYRAHCSAGDVTPPWARRSLKRSFVVTDQTVQMGKRAVRSWLELDKKEVLRGNQRIAWAIPGAAVDASYRPLGVEGAIARSLQNMQKLADLLAQHRIPLTVAVYPWPAQIVRDDRDSRHVTMWRDFCVRNCKAFINTFPAFFAERDARKDWYERLFIAGDFHFSPEGNRVIYRELAQHLLAAPRSAKGPVTTNSE